MAGSKPAIEERQLQAGELTVKLFVIAAEYPTAVGAQAAWKRVERIRTRSDDVSVVRLKRETGPGSVIVGLAEDEAQLRPLRRQLAQGGLPHVPDERTLMMVYMRRGRVAQENSPRPGGIKQKASYGEDGATISVDGQVRAKPRQG